MDEETKNRILFWLMIIILTILILVGLLFYPHINDCPSGMCNTTGVIINGCFV